ncbi:MAG TPA: hypothetical protein VGM12_20130 [Trebonia sp.]|jgi:hypothetical protein
MRHLIGIGLAIGLSAAVFFAGSWGYLRLLRVPVVNGAVSALPAGGLLHDTSVLLGFAAVAGTGLLAGTFIAVRRISPLAAGLPGLGLIGWTVWYGLNLRQAMHYIPLRAETYGTGFEAMLTSGVLGAAGLALAVPLFLPSRWRGARYGDEQYEQGQPGGWDPRGADPDQAPTTTISLLADDWTGTAPYPEGDQFRRN